MTRTFDARPDSMDFRDEMFVPTLVNVPALLPLARYREHNVPILDQGREGACTGYALATVCNYLLRTARSDADIPESVSPKMLYTMAKRYDEWPGVDYEGSSARGAMKGWHKHGVCDAERWPSTGRGRHRNRLTAARAEAAAQIPLGAYFRVNHKDLVAMHAAISEVAVLFATAIVHGGWDEVGEDGLIHRQEQELGGHAFAIVGYDQDGFWIQNSWGEDWGKGGFAHLSYSDWLANGMDVWVARLGVPIRVDEHATSTGRRRGSETSQFSFSELRGHIVTLGNDGALCTTGQFGNDADDIKELFEHHIPQAMQGWDKPRILIYAHGGLVSEKSAVETIESNLPLLLQNQVYPVAFVWKTDFWNTLKNLLRDALGRRKSEGWIDATKDFMLDRLDDALEPLAFALGGKLLWSEMKENALRATTEEDGGARLVAEYLAGFAESQDVPVHLAAHSAGSILLAPFAQLLAGPTSGINQGPMADYEGFGVPIASCHHWAPACTVELFKETYLPLLKSGALERYALYNLSDKAERDDDCANIYHKSLLYLVSNAFEERHRIPVLRKHGTPILGMQKFVDKDDELQQVIAAGKARHILCPNALPADGCDASRASTHGAFDNDAATRVSTLNDILGTCAIDVGAAEDPVLMPSSAQVQGDRRAIARAALSDEPSRT